MKQLKSNTSNWLTKPVVIGYLINRLTNDIGELNSAEKVYLEIAKSYFDNALDGLNSIKNVDRKMKINCDASWFYSSMNKNHVIKGKYLPQTISRIREERRRLEFLIQNPIESYENGNSKKLASFIERLQFNCPD